MPPSDQQTSRSEQTDAAASGLVQKDAVFDLFGGSKDWSPEHWTASDDRVRGGKSRSYLNVSKNASSATFCGNLDIETLGGAGFASQRTTSAAGGPWDLSMTSGLRIGIEDTDERIYTLVAKDVILPKRPDGREQSTLSYEFSFSICNQLGESQSSKPSSVSTYGTAPALVSPQMGNTSKDNTSLPIVIFIPWANFKPYYRGKKNPDASPLNTSEVKRLSIMCRSMFGSQSGKFSMTVKSISALTLTDKTHMETLCYPLCSVDSTNGVQDIFVLHRSWLRPAADVQEPDRDAVNMAEWDLIEDLEKLKVGGGSIPGN
ncbi:hypothetical protein Dda_8313 [Drechslerella dactyloides]|uniref:NADH:ubiquinone oxidoreductase intermediate-associated protein 30 domain-containing protein n=1 Tax=Drechslerella dactyloides TaxID=74499 RepID=A0AAD6NI41_DREDA|nr:hypothetical protein Dda_8313 [Drechslerella dactyloides]